MKVVADTNIFIAITLNEPEKQNIINMTKDCDILAPEVIPYEIGNALTALMKKRVLEADEVQSAWHEIQKIEVDLRPVNFTDALEIATKFSIYAYDAYFLSCAKNLKIPLLTLDGQMKSVAEKMGITLMELTK